MVAFPSYVDACSFGAGDPSAGAARFTAGNPSTAYMAARKSSGGSDAGSAERLSSKCALALESRACM